MALQIEHDTGHLTFGRSQTTLSTGNLARLIGAYCDNAGARFGARRQGFLQALRERDTRLDRDTKLHNLLRASADDPLMRDIQDAFFDMANRQSSMVSVPAKTRPMPGRR